MRTGPAPKNAKHSRSGGVDWVDVPNVPYYGPDPERAVLEDRWLPLPKTPGVSWFPQTEDWWRVFTTMPHCALWQDSDWVAAFELAYMKNAYWAEFFGGNASTAMATEIRRREDNMGATMEARRKLGIRYIEPPTEAAPQPEADSAVVDINTAASRRSRLAG